MLNKEQIRNKLQDMVILRVAEKSGIPSQTLYRLMSGKDIKSDTLEKLSNYLEGK